MRACCLPARRLRDIGSRGPKLRTPVSAASRAMWKLHQLLEREKRVVRRLRIEYPGERGHSTETFPEQTAQQAPLGAVGDLG
jgi:hypothetical protein